MPDFSPDDAAFERLAESERESSAQSAPSRLKARVFSALQLAQAGSGPLRSVSETMRDGRKLCVFEDLVRIAPIGERIKSWNPCRVCHARILGEAFENPPVFWPNCPYVMFKGPKRS